MESRDTFDDSPSLVFPSVSHIEDVVEHLFGENRSVIDCARMRTWATVPARPLEPVVRPGPMSRWLVPIVMEVLESAAGRDGDR
jgi:hypothetical protein